MAEGPMETERIALSQRERDRLKVLHEIQQKHLTQVAGAARLKISDRQGREMLPVFTDGAADPRTASCQPAWSRRFWRACSSVMRISDPRWLPNTWPRR